MKNINKGFTLVEMIAALVILCSLFLLSLSSILNVINNTTIKLNESQEAIIKEAALDYLEGNETYEQNNGDNYCITVKTFIDNNYLTKEQIPDMDEDSIVNVEVTKKGLNIELAYYCTEEVNKITFELKGSKNITLDKGNTLTDPGFTAKNKDGEDIRNNVTVKYYDKDMYEINTINTTFVGTYLIEYVLEIDNKKYVLERGVNVELSDKPVITHPGNTTIKSTVTSFDILEGVSATDQTGNDLDVSVTTNLTLGVAGDYYIEYKATDKSGNKQTSIRNITIIALYEEALLAGAYPFLDENMIPVTIENDGTVKKADMSEEWYKYEDKLWANAILVVDGKLNQYKNADPKSVIAQNDIHSYFVWIPRYKYKIPTSGTAANPPTIDIVFESKSKTKSTGNASTSYLTHPAFSYGNRELSGIWIGKFETTGFTYAPTILPNQEALRNEKLNTFSQSSSDLEDYLSTHNTALSKNTEWVSVTYLAHSNYGIKKEVRINNNCGFTTGCGASQDDGGESSTCQIAYGSNVSEYPQSTTGNITGVFDMAGGANEFVMGNYNNYYGMTDFIDIGYLSINVYGTISHATACDGGVCLGHGLTETKGWYGDYNSGSFSTAYPWITKGGSYYDSSLGGIFTTFTANGAANNMNSFRISLADYNI